MGHIPALDDRLKVKTGINEDAQLGSFCNATLQSVGHLAVSIAVTLPDHMHDLAETTAPQEELAAALREDFKALTDMGYEVEIQIGLDSDHADEDDEDYDDQGNLKAGCGHND